MLFRSLRRMTIVGLRVTLCCPDPEVTSMNGVVVQAQSNLEDAATAQAVLIGSGVKTREHIASHPLVSRIKLNPEKQLIAAQCSGVWLLSSLGLLSGHQACTDLSTKPRLQEADIDVLDRPFFAAGNVATAGGCLASIYLASWLIARLEGLEAAAKALASVAPVGEKEELVAKVEIGRAHV